jgi:hypothetical protein
MNATAKTTAHANCSHAATKADRAKCRRQKAAYAASVRETLTEIIASYYGCSAEVEEIMGALHKIDPALTASYYDNTGEVEEIIAAAARYGA